MTRCEMASRLNALEGQIHRRARTIRDKGPDLGLPLWLDGVARQLREVEAALRAPVESTGEGR